jgi:gas vesicle protein
MKKGGFLLGLLAGTLLGAAAVIFTNEDNEYVRLARDKAEDFKQDISKTASGVKEQLGDVTARAAEKAEIYKNQVEGKVKEFKKAADNVADVVKDELEELSDND